MFPSIQARSLEYTYRFRLREHETPSGHEEADIKVYDIARRCLAKIRVVLSDLTAPYAGQIRDAFQGRNSEVLLSLCAGMIPEAFRPPFGKNMPHHEAMSSSLIDELIASQEKRIQEGQEQILTFSKFSNANATLANGNLEMARAYAQEREYSDALAAYAKAFRFTNSIEVYAEIPPLYISMNEPEKALLAYLYLTKYQLAGKRIEEAIATLDTCKQLKPEPSLLSLLLANAYILAGQEERALTLIQSDAAACTDPLLAKQMHTLAINLNVRSIDSYDRLAALETDPQTKSHILIAAGLQAACQQDGDKAATFFQRARETYKDCYLDRCPEIELEAASIPNQDAISRGQQVAALHELGQYYLERKPREALKLYKDLIRMTLLKGDEGDVARIIALYEKLGKASERIMRWAHSQFNLAFHEKSWTKARLLGNALIGRSNDQEKIPLYERLEEVYLDGDPKLLDEFWTKLGALYTGQREFAKAVVVYRKANTRHPTYMNALNYARALREEGRATRPEVINAYFNALQTAMEASGLDDIRVCMGDIECLQPPISSVNDLPDPFQRSNFLYCRLLIKTQDQFQARISRLEAELTASRQRTRDAFLQLNALTGYSNNVYGKEEWEKYFGDVGVVSPIPDNIRGIWNQQDSNYAHLKWKDLHLLIWVPERVNGKPLTLATLGELAQNPREGHRSQYKNANFAGYENVPAPPGHWVMMGGYKMKSSEYGGDYSHGPEVSGNYQAPTLLELIVRAFICHAATGQCLGLSGSYRSYNRGSVTFRGTYCAEAGRSDKSRMAVTDFGPDGISVGERSTDYYSKGHDQDFHMLIGVMRG